MSCAKKITYLARDGFQGEKGRSHESNDRESGERCQGATVSLSLTAQILTKSLQVTIYLTGCRYSIVILKGYSVMRIKTP